MDVSSWTDATRPLVTIVLIGTACYLAIVGMIDAKDFLSLVTVVVLFWFKERADAKTSEQNINQIKTLTENKREPVAP